MQQEELRMYCIDTEALVFMFNGGSPYGFINHINDEKQVHHGFLAPRPYLCSTSLIWQASTKYLPSVMRFGQWLFAIEHHLCKLCNTSGLTSLLCAMLIYQGYFSFYVHVLSVIIVVSVPCVCTLFNTWVRQIGSRRALKRQEHNRKVKNHWWRPPVTIVETHHCSTSCWEVDKRDCLRTDLTDNFS